MKQSIKSWQTYCCEDLSNIENYEDAMLNPDNYVIHHRLGEYMKREELQERGLYFNRPAKELIFLTKSLHTSLHARANINFRMAQFGVHRTEEEKTKMANTRRERKTCKSRILCLTNNTIYVNAATACRELGIPTTGNIHRVCRGQRKTTNGLEFRYYEE